MPGTGGGVAETLVILAGYRQPGERHQAAGRPDRRGSVAHVPERGHPPGQQPQMPVGEHLLEGDHIRVRSLESLADCLVSLGQLRPGDRHSARVESHDSQPGIPPRPTGTAVPIQGLAHGTSAPFMSQLIVSQRVAHGRPSVH